MNGKTQDSTPADDEGGWDFIARYTRAQALEDGALVDVSETAREAGIALPVALTHAVWAEYVALSPAAEKARNDERGRLWDILWMFRCAVCLHRDDSEFLFELYVVTTSVKPSLVQLHAVCGPDDDGEPVITILMPGED